MEFALQFVAVGAVLSLAGGAAWLLRKSRVGPVFRAAGRELVVRERLQLTPQHSLHVVQFREREILLAVHPGGCVVIEETP